MMTHPGPILSPTFFRIWPVFSIGIICWTALASPTPAQSICTWHVYPEVVAVSPLYPATLALVGKNAEGKIERTIALEALQGTVKELPAQVAWDDQGRLEAKSNGSGTLLLEIEQQVVSVPITVWGVGETQIDFHRDVHPIFSRHGCNAGICHGSLHGKGGLRLSLRGEDAHLDLDTLLSDAGGRRIDRIIPRSSLLLRKAVQDISHQGGARFSLDSPSAMRLMQWMSQPSIRQSIDLESRNEPTLRLWPEEAWLEGAEQPLPLIVQAIDADGSVRDVTPWVRWETSVVDGASVDDQGQLQVSKPMDLSVSAYLGSSSRSARIAFVPHASQRVAYSLHHPVDALVNQRLERWGIAPMPLADDWTWLRRATLVVAGRLPTVEEIRSLEAASPIDRRDLAIDRLLQEPGAHWRWALHWSDLLRNEPKTMSRKGVDRWNRWLQEQAASDRPAEQWVRELVTTLGSTYDSPPASFHRVHREPEVAAEAVSQVFLGVRLQCARCHSHPFDRWTQDDYYGMAAFFGAMERKAVDNQPPDKLDTHVITGDEIISVADRKPRVDHPGKGRKVPPRPLPLQSQSHPTSQVPWKDLSPKEGLDALGDWLVTDNRLFARNMVNRIFFHLFGIGLIDPPDDLRQTNPASHPELLEYLTDQWLSHDQSTSHVMRLLLTSDTFARQSVSVAEPENALGIAGSLAGYPIHRMSAELVEDAVSDATAMGWTGEIPKEDTGELVPAVLRRAIERGPSPKGADFLKAFGKPDRLLSCECERSSDTSLAQSLQLLNGGLVREKIEAKSNRLGMLLREEASREAIIEQLYLATLSRRPTDQEQQAMIEHLERSDHLRRACEDLLWALLNSKEFQWIR
ncbi:MAG: DUF1549 and DUF1553 domain-containing protein [Pirellulaceae bacterium]